MEIMVNRAARCVTEVHTLTRSLPIEESKLLPIPLVLWTTMVISQHLQCEGRGWRDGVRAEAGSRTD